MRVLILLVVCISIHSNFVFADSTIRFLNGARLEVINARDENSLIYYGPGSSIKNIISSNKNYTFTLTPQGASLNVQKANETIFQGRTPQFWPVVVNDFSLSESQKVSNPNEYSPSKTRIYVGENGQVIVLAQRTPENADDDAVTIPQKWEVYRFNYNSEAYLGFVERRIVMIRGYNLNWVEFRFLRLNDGTMAYFRPSISSQADVALDPPHGNIIFRASTKKLETMSIENLEFRPFQNRENNTEGWFPNADFAAIKKIPLTPFDYLTLSQEARSATPTNLKLRQASINILPAENLIIENAFDDNIQDAMQDIKDRHQQREAKEARYEKAIAGFKTKAQTMARDKNRPYARYFAKDFKNFKELVGSIKLEILLEPKVVVDLIYDLDSPKGLLDAMTMVKDISSNEKQRNKTSNENIFISDLNFEGIESPSQPLTLASLCNRALGRNLR